jgi:excisionase family DNA binding protein
MATDERDLYPLAEAHHRLGISDKSIRNLIKDGKITAVYQGRYIYVSREAIDAYVATLKPVRDPAA